MTFKQNIVENLKNLPEYLLAKLPRSQITNTHISFGFWAR